MFRIPFLPRHHWLQALLDDGRVALEQKVAFELFSGQKQREPLAVVGPHQVERNGVRIEPLWLHFCET